jgi:hypothetical protein
MCSHCPKNDPPQMLLVTVAEGVVAGCLAFWASEMHFGLCHLCHFGARFDRASEMHFALCHLCHFGACFVCAR